MSCCSPVCYWADSSGCQVWGISGNASADKSSLLDQDKQQISLFVISFLQSATVETRKLKCLDLRFLKVLKVLVSVRLSLRLCKIIVQFVIFRLFSGHLESVFHCPRQQCLLSNIIWSNQKPGPPNFSFSPDFLVEKTTRSYKTFYRTVILVWVMWGVSGDVIYF